ATTQELAAAKVLRQAIWDAAHARAARRPLPAEAVTAINQAAATPPLTPELTSSSAAVAPLAPGLASSSAAAPPLAPGSAGVSMAAGWAAPVRATQALSTLAREMIELLAGPFSGRIRECASS